MGVGCLTETSQNLNTLDFVICDSAKEELPFGSEEDASFLFRVHAMRAVTRIWPGQSVVFHCASAYPGQYANQLRAREAICAVLRAPIALLGAQSVGT